MRGRRVGVKPGTPEWLAWRAQGITATDTAAILGLSPWTSAYNLWWQKRADRETLAAGGTLTDEFDRTRRYEVGHALEPVLEQFYVADVLPQGWRVGSGGCWQARGKHAWMRATPDRMVYGDQSTRTPCSLVEFKTSGRYGSFGEDDGSGVPDIPVAYRAQMIHQFLVCGVTSGTLTVLTASMEPRHYYVAAQDEELLTVFEAVQAFERSLHEGQSPDIDSHTATTERIREMWGEDNDGSTVTVDDDLAQQYAQAAAAFRAAKAELDLAKNLVLAAIGPGRAAVTIDGTPVATRSVSKPRRTDHAAVRDVLDSLTSTFPLDPRAITAQASAPTITLRAAPTPKKKPTPIEKEAT